MSSQTTKNRLHMINIPRRWD